MNKKTDFGNVITAMITPFKADKAQTVDLDRAVSLANYLLQNGTDSLLLTGSTGEDAQLESEEKWAILKSVRQNTPSGTKIIVSAGDTNTGRAIRKAQTAFELGADAVLVPAPEYIKPTQQAMEIHFGAIAKAIQGKPMLIYNIPSRTGVEILPETVMGLAYSNSNIIGIKQSHSNLNRISEMKGNRLSASLPDFQIYSGDDNLTLPMLAMGAKGVISVASHLKGRLIQEMIRSFKEGRVELARQIHQGLFPLFEALFVETNPLPVKEALYQKGMIDSPTLRTLGEMTGWDKKGLERLLKMYDKPQKNKHLPLSDEELIQSYALKLRRLEGKIQRS